MFMKVILLNFNTHLKKITPAYTPSVIHRRNVFIKKNGGGIVRFSVYGKGKWEGVGERFASAQWQAKRYRSGGSASLKLEWVE